MTVFAILILTVSSFLIVVAPFFRQRQRRFLSAVDDMETDFVSKSGNREVMLQQADYEYKAGIMSEEDYYSLQDEYYENDPAAVRDEAVGKVASIDAEIEMKVARLRGAGTSPVSDEIEDRVSRLRREQPTRIPRAADKTGDVGRRKARFCSKCGAGRRPGDRFCVQCGAKLGQGET